MASEVIKLNLIPKGEMPVFHCSQFDNGRLINIELYRGEDAYTIPEGCTAELHCRKVDGNIVTIGSPVVDENTIKFTSTTQLTACNGKNLCEVAILGADDYLIGSSNFWLEVEVDPLKGGINSTSEIHDLYEQIEDITAEVIGDDYYDKTEVDNLLDDKADKSTTYTKTQVDTLLTAKADKSNVYTKAETTTLLAAKADADNVYTKAQVETKLAAKADAAAVYTKDETDALLDTKANAATTYTKTEVDTALALKANAADVYTKAETDAAIEAAIDDILPVDTAGPSAIANFTTGLASPLVDCKVGILATGGNGTPDNPIPIVGYSSANITRCGVNLWDEETELGYINTNTGLDGNTNNELRSKSGVYYKIAPNTTYCLVRPVTGVMVLFYDENKTYTGSKVTTTGEFTTPNNAAYFRITLGSSYGTTYNNDISINYPSTDTAYHAYNGQTYTIAFGQTVYGGVLDVTRGKLRVTWTIIDLGDDTLNYSYNSTYHRFDCSNDLGAKPAPNNNTPANALCSCYKNGCVNDVGTDDKFFYIAPASGQGKLRVVDTDYSSVATFKTAVAGQKVAFELATPFDIDLTPEVISAIVGVNNVFGDTNGDTTVKFKDTIQNYIDKKVST